MAAITNMVPIRIDASSSDGAVRIIDTLLIDTTCLPISHAPPPYAENSSGLGSISGGMVDRGFGIFSLSSLVDANAAHLAESILADAEVYGAVRSSSKTFMGGRLDLLGDIKLYQEIEKQIARQLSIALGTDKKDLISSGGTLSNETSPTPDSTVSSADRAQITSDNTQGESKTNPIPSNIVRIKLRLRHENIVVVDEFDYDINSSGMEGCDPVSMADCIVEDMKLPAEMATSIAASIVEQIYGVNVSGSLEQFTSSVALRGVPTALVLDNAREGSLTDHAQIMFTS